MRNGDVIPYYLQGHEFNPSRGFPGLDDFYVEMVEGLLSSTYIRQDNGETDSWPEVITTQISPQLEQSQGAKAGASQSAGQIIRRAEICYATLRYELVEMEWPIRSPNAPTDTSAELS
jgi:hypothetical protein